MKLKLVPVMHKAIRVGVEKRKNGQVRPRNAVNVQRGSCWNLVTTGILYGGMPGEFLIEGVQPYEFFQKAVEATLGKNNR